MISPIVKVTNRGYTIQKNSVPNKDLDQLRLI